MKPKKQTQEKAQSTNPLVGRFFHEIKIKYDKNGTKHEVIRWQGIVINCVTQEVYIVQLFSWLDGQPTHQRLIKIEDMALWRFYDNSESMNFEYDNYERRMRNIIPNLTDDGKG